MISTNNAIAKKNKNQYPSIFRSSLLDDFFGGWPDIESMFFEKGSVPCDIAEIKDENGDIIANEFTYALAGYDKDNVSIEVDDDRLTIKVDKKEEIDDESKNYIHKGLTKKTHQWSYVLNNSVSAEGIKASMEQGLLKVYVPIQKEIKNTVKKIDIE